jgi:hypothetical protein
VGTVWIDDASFEVVGPAKTPATGAVTTKKPAASAKH